MKVCFKFSQAQEAKIRKGHAEGVYGIRHPCGLKREKNCWQHCMDRFAQLAMCFLFQLAVGPFCLGRAGADLFSYGRK